MGNREKIVECALDLFCRKGYESVGVQEICTAAGVTKPTLYYYFKSTYGLVSYPPHEYAPPLLPLFIYLSTQPSLIP